MKNRIIMWTMKKESYPRKVLNIKIENNLNKYSHLIKQGRWQEGVYSVIDHPEIHRCFKKNVKTGKYPTSKFWRQWAVANSAQYLLHNRKWVNIWWPSNKWIENSWNTTIFSPKSKDKSKFRHISPTKIY